MPLLIQRGGLGTRTVWKRQVPASVTQEQWSCLLGCGGFHVQPCPAHPFGASR